MRHGKGSGPWERKWPEETERLEVRKRAKGKGKARGKEVGQRKLRG